MLVILRRRASPIAVVLLLNMAVAVAMGGLADDRLAALLRGE